MTHEEILATFAELGVLQEGHFRLTSGLHSSQYMQCATLFEQPRVAEKIIQAFLPQLPRGVETVVVPAVGGITVGYEVARALGCRFIFAERQEGQMTLGRGFSLQPQEQVLVVEDVVTTGGSVREVLEIVQEAGCETLAVASLVDRSEGKAQFGVPFVSLLEIEIKTHEPERCPLCQAGLPIVKPGSR